MKRIAFLAAGFILVAFGGVATCLAAVPPVSGATCMNSETKLGENLPLGASSKSTEVMNIFGITNGSQILGWYYGTRRGERFIQSRKGQLAALSSLLNSIDLKQLGGAVAYAPPQSYIFVNAKSAKIIEAAFRSRSAFAYCFSNALSPSSD
jgi:hypothetical protein